MFQKSVVTVKNGLRSVLSLLDTHPIRFLCGTALLYAFLIEILSRRSLDKAFVFLVTAPHMFLCNAILLLFTLSLCLLVPKRRFVFSLVSLIWFGLAIANCVVLSLRTTPLSAIDLVLLPSVFTIIYVYLNIFEIILICVAILAAVGALVLLCIKEKNKKIPWKKSILLSVASLAATLAIYVITIPLGAIPMDEFSNLPGAYHDYGFTYCFSLSVTNRGISRPQAYSRASVEQIVKQISKTEKKPKTTPNIIFIQLESFFDVNYLEDISFDPYPTPCFQTLKNTYSSGFLTVPTIGAGTANTEFEVISGMNLDYFGVGEFPYTTILQDTVCESVCYDLKPLGYVTHALHNHSGDFYDRNTVYANLGFDTFTSLEYMNNVETNALSWAKDTCLTGEILKILASTKQQDLIFGISVQAHGKYITDPKLYTPETQVYGVESAADKVAYGYYADQLRGTDEFISQLIAALNKWSEPTVVVFYGDHLPSFSELDDDKVSNGNAFQTEYVIWSNFSMKTTNRDLESYQLSAYTLQKLGISSGTMILLHQNYAGNPNYCDAMEMLEYDMLYGDMAVYGGTCPYAPTNLQMGTYPIVLRSVHIQDGHTYLSGSGFTPFSHVYMNDEEVDCSFINSSTLFLERDTLPENAVFYVAQHGEYGSVLSRTSDVVYMS